MSVFREGPVRAVVPATSANLGPGFDSLGLALTMCDELDGEVTGSGLTIDIDGVEAGLLPRDESHLVVVAMRTVFAAIGMQPQGLRLHCRNKIPHGRGLGSSAAAIVGGIVLARGLIRDGDERLDDAAALRMATRLEGHPDNVAAALLGGFTIAWLDPDGGRATRMDVSASPVVFIPPDPVPTDLARGLLPEAISHAEAARNAGRAALLVTALSGRPELLLAATEDCLHQRFRASAMPQSLDLVARLRADGIAAVISGAGPTVLAFGTDPEHGAALASWVPKGWDTRTLAVDHLGARVVRAAAPATPR